LKNETNGWDQTMKAGRNSDMDQKKRIKLPNPLTVRIKSYIDKSTFQYGGKGGGSCYPFFCLFLILFLFFGLWLLLGAHVAHAQQYHFRTWEVEDGLPQSQVYDVLQDRRGSLWVCTNGGGVARFNGIRFEQYSTHQGLVHNQVRKGFEDSRGNLWFATYRGLSRYDGQQFTNFTNEHGYPDCLYAQVFEDRNGAIWVYTLIEPGNSKLLFLEGNRLVDLASREPLLRQFPLISKPFLRSVYRTSQGTLLLTTEGGLLEVVDGQVTRSALQEVPSFQGREIRVLLEDRKGRAWVHAIGPEGRSSLFTLSGGRAEEFQLPQGISAGQVRLMLEDAQGNIWLTGNEAGLVRYRDGRFQVFDRSNGLLADLMYVYALTEDREGNIWLGTNNSLVRYSGQRFVLYSSTEAEGAESVNALFEDSKGRVWIGNSAGEVIRHADGQETVLLPASTSPIGRLNGMIELRDGAFLLATHRGIWHYSSESLHNVSRQYGVLPTTQVSGFSQVGDTLWISTFNEGAVRYVGGTATAFTHESHGLASNYVRTIQRDSRGRLWFCTFAGVSRLDGQRFIHYGPESGLKRELVFQMAEDKAGGLWFASFGSGLAHFNGQRFTYLTTEEGLASDNLYSVLTDRHGSLWVGTQFGVDRLALGPQGRVLQVRNYGQPDGFMGGETNGNVNLRASDGTLWFGTKRGAVRYSPEANQAPHVPPVAKMTGLRLFYEPVEWAAPAYVAYHEGVAPWTALPLNLSLPFGLNHLSFVFEALYYRAPEKVRYQWMLEGLDRDWSPESDRTEVVYPELPPGSYTFLVRARNGDGVWTEEPARFAFSVTPPLWRRGWFLVSAAVLLLAGVVLAVRAVTGRRLRRRLREMELQQSLQQERARISRDLHDNVGANLAMILLNLNQSASSTPDPDEQCRISRIREYAKQTIDQLRQTIWAIHKENLKVGDLEHKVYRLLQEYVGPEASLAWQVTTTGDPSLPLSSNQALNLFRLTQEAISNSLHHSRARHLRVNLQTIADQELVVTVKDDGQGFDPDAEVPEDHYGLHNMKARAQDIGATLTIHSAAGSGTTVRLRLPLREGPGKK
jgi:signal transduction histidine kinase/ligand-binding sensor domain-containing protein